MVLPSIWWWAVGTWYHKNRSSAAMANNLPLHFAWFQLLCAIGIYLSISIELGNRGPIVGSVKNLELGTRRTYKKGRFLISPCSGLSWCFKSTTVAVEWIVVAIFVHSSTDVSPPCLFWLCFYYSSTNRAVLVRVISFTISLLLLLQWWEIRIIRIIRIIIMTVTGHRLINHHHQPPHNCGQMIN